MSNLAFLVKSRGYKRAQVTKLNDKVNGRLAELSEEEKFNSLSKLEQLSFDLRKLNDEIHSIKFKDDTDDAELENCLEECDHYDELIVESVNTLKRGLAVNSDNVPITDRTLSNRLKLPEVPLPEYSNGKSETLDYFLRTFTSIVEKHSLSSYEKFVLLKNQLKGEPLYLVNSLDVAEQSYENAESLLKRAFASEVCKKFDAVKRLAELKLSSNSNIYEFVGEMRTIENLFKTLEIKADTVMQYFFWNSMSPELQTQLVSISNCNKPDLNQINEYIFQAVDRYLEIIDKSKPKVTISYGKSTVVNSSAVNVDNFIHRKPFCTLCSDKIKETSHLTKDCSVYKTPEAKVKRLRGLGACVICGYANHSSADCKFRFTKGCFNCGDNHMSFLCCNNSRFVKNGGAVKNSKGTSKNLVSTNTACAVALNIDVGSEAVLPTFTCKLRGRKVRGMKDSGCQPHFIRSDLAKQLNLPVVHRNFSLTVNGFNETQDYVTDVVKVELEMNGKVRKIEAICIPEIRTKLLLPDLGRCVKEFTSRNFKLADDFLNEESVEISNLDLILGVNDPDILLEKQVLFGGQYQSVFSETDSGIMLYGNLKLMLKNLSCLPGKVCNRNSVCSETVSNSKTEQPETNLIEANSTRFNASSAVLNDDGELNVDELNKATQEMLQISLNYENKIYNEDSTEVNRRAVECALEKCNRLEDGRICMPLLWNEEVKHLLGNNFGLAKKILISNLHKFQKDKSKLKLIDDVFKQQEEDSIIERVPLDNSMISESEYSFLPHMPVFKPERSTTKCRVVFLSNLCEDCHKGSMSHNQVIHAGPCLNQKITSAVNNLRFGEYMLTYDLKKAFLQISLDESDSNKLMFLWFQDVMAGNYSLVAYRNLRLSFGLRASPTILMLVLYKILCLDSNNDDSKIKEMKSLLFALIYMDNGAYTGSADEVMYAYENLDRIFNPYKFQLQQITSNHSVVQSSADRASGDITPDSVKLLGLNWNRTNDKISAGPIKLSPNANTKRSILKSVAEQFDMHNFHGPLLNRARIFLHELQCQKELSWDEILKPDQLNLWKNIVTQANSSTAIEITRCVGQRDDPYELIAFADASKNIYATVLYLKNLKSGKVSFMTAKNRLVNKQLELKSIPMLELHSISLAVETLVDIREQLCGSNVLCSINIVEMSLYTDSMISLHWINAYNYKLEKMRNLSVFVLNRLESIHRACLNNSVSFRFVNTGTNPADCLTRPLSYKMLMKSEYISGPRFLSEDGPSLFEVKLPNPKIKRFDFFESKTVSAVTASAGVPIKLNIPIKKFSKFKSAVRVQAKVMLFVGRILRSLHMKGKLTHIEAIDESNVHDRAVRMIIRADQQEHFHNIFEFFERKSNLLKDIPPLVNKLNLFLDDGILKVKSKLSCPNGVKYAYPILLSKNSDVAKLIIRDTHEDISHGGCYTLLSHLRKKFWIESFFSTVKKVLKDCIICRRFNSRTVKLNQNKYRDFRANPPKVPFKYVFIDYFGPFTVKYNKNRQKVWILIFTCLWSRSVNLKI